jgi:hypothetical protein
MASLYHAERLRSCQKFALSHLSAAQDRICHKTNLNGFFVVVRRARESTDALGPIKDRANWQDNQREQRDRHRHMPLSNARKSVPCFSACKEQDKEVHNISTSTSIVTHGSGCITQMAIVVL